MPVSTDIDEPPAKCCKFCDDSSHKDVWNIKIDPDILTTIKDTFPNWFTTKNTTLLTPSSLVASTSKLTAGVQTSFSIKIENNPFNNFLDIENSDKMAKDNSNAHSSKIYNCLPSLVEISDETNPNEKISKTLSTAAGSLIVPQHEYVGDTRQSPPKAIVDSSPLQSSMDKNRESLKVKLMVRRSVNQLVEQGIMPPLKTSPAIHEQRKLLERAKTGDLLKAKIQQRPDRQELERRHILETHEGHIDPSLVDKYRMLEKAILLDQLNSKISHRPGPLELIEKNILHAEEPIERIVKEGLLFKTEPSESNDTFIQFEDDSQSSEGDQQQQQHQQQQQQQQQHQQQQLQLQQQQIHLHNQQVQQQQQQQLLSRNQQLLEISTNDQHALNQIKTRNVLETAAASAGIINISVAVPKHEFPVATVNFQVPSNAYTINNRTEIPPPPPPPIKTETITYHIKPIVTKQEKSTSPPALIKTNNNLLQLIPDLGSPLSTSSLSPASSIASQSPITVSQKSNIASIVQNNQKYSAPGKDKNRKKAKSKPVSKIRAIKFHEYKGPPNAQKSSVTQSSIPVASTSNSNNNNNNINNNNTSRKNAETNYELILQQQCLLEYLEGIYKQPIHSSQKNSTDVSLNSSCSNSVICDSPSSTADSNNNSESTAFQENSVNMNVNVLPEKSNVTTTVANIMKPSQQQITIFPSPITPMQSLSSTTIPSNNDLAKLNKMKVSDLKAHLKRLNLPVSGPKPLLIERLKPFLPLESVDSEETISSSNSQEIDNSVYGSVSSESDHDFMDVQKFDSPPNYNIAVSSSKEDDLVKEQQRKIEELQRKLRESQEQLEQMKQTKSLNVLKHEDEIKQEPESIAFIPNSNIIYENSHFQISNPLQTVFVVDMHQDSPPKLPEPEKKLESSGKFFPQISKKQSQNLSKIQRMEDPPGYEEAAANSNKKYHEKEAVKDQEKALSQEITDVLEILIQNGELPESAVDPQQDFTHLMINPNEMFDTNSDTVLNSVSSTSDLLIDYNIMSPMQEDTSIISSSEKTMDKLLGQAQNNMPSVPSLQKTQIITETSPNSSTLSNPSAILSNFNDIELGFPMEIEDESNPLSPIHDTNFNSSTSNKINNNFRLDIKLPTKSDNCDSNLSNLFNNINSNFNNSTKHNSDFNNVLKSGSTFIMDHPHKKTNDSLISNFSHGLENFNNSNNNMANNLFNKPDDSQMIRYNNIHYNTNNINSSNNNNNESTPMDFEHIFDLHDNINDQDNYNHINLHPFDTTLFNDLDFRMSNECEVDNLCN